MVPFVPSSRHISLRIRCQVYEACLLLQYEERDGGELGILSTQSILTGSRVAHCKCCRVK